MSYFKTLHFNFHSPYSEPELPNENTKKGLNHCLYKLSMLSRMIRLMRLWDIPNYFTKTILNPNNLSIN